MANQMLLLTTLLAVTCALVIAFEPSPLQDFCVADTTSSGSYRNYWFMYNLHFEKYVCFFFFLLDRTMTLTLCACVVN